MAARLDGILADRDSWQARHCSIAKALDVVGTRSAMLILREAIYGTTRFDDFANRVGITEAVTAARLKELTAAGIFERRPYKIPGSRTRYEYALTEMGRDLVPVIIGLMQWGDTYLQGARGKPLDVVEDATGSTVTADIRTSDGRRVELDELRVQTTSANSKP
ncbi:winged helix-turn-helix transcriptional regulator [Actinomycetes bacterium M1A6_2h]